MPCRRSLLRNYRGSRGRGQPPASAGVPVRPGDPGVRCRNPGGRAVPGSPAKPPPHGRGIRCRERGEPGPKDIIVQWLNGQWAGCAGACMPAGRPRRRAASCRSFSRAATRATGRDNPLIDEGFMRRAATRATGRAARRRIRTPASGPVSRAASRCSGGTGAWPGPCARWPPTGRAFRCGALEWPAPSNATLSSDLFACKHMKSLSPLSRKGTTFRRSRRRNPGRSARQVCFFRPRRSQTNGAGFHFSPACGRSFAHRPTPRRAGRTSSIPSCRAGC